MTTRRFNSTPIKNYLDEVGDLPPDLLLGRIVMFTISGTSPVRRDWLEQEFTRLGLDAAHLPATNKKLDAWKKATSDTTDTYPMSRDRTAHLLCRDVTSTPDYVRRQITREIRDSRRKKLGYDEAVTVTFYRPTSPSDQTGARLQTIVRPENLERSEIAQITAIAHDIETRYERYYAFIDAQKLRAMVRSYLRKLNAIEIKGGVYFVSSTRDEELQLLADMVNRLGEPGPVGASHMDMIPVLDMPKQRAFMTRVFEREAAETLQALTSEVTDLVANRKSVTQAMYLRMKARYDEVLDNAVEHMGTLQISQDITSASAEVALKALNGLQAAWLESDA